MIAALLRSSRAAPTLMAVAIGGVALAWVLNEAVDSDWEGRSPVVVAVAIVIDVGFMAASIAAAVSALLVRSTAWKIASLFLGLGCVYVGVFHMFAIFLSSEDFSP